MPKPFPRFLGCDNLRRFEQRDLWIIVVLNASPVPADPLFDLETPSIYYFMAICVTHTAAKTFLNWIQVGGVGWKEHQ